MSRRLLIACYETPGYGGASTSTYNLFERMQADGSQVCYLNLIDEPIQAFLRSTFGAAFDNPRGLDRVHTHLLEGRFHDPQPALAAKIRGIAPDVILANGYIAALAVKAAARETPLIFFTTGCNQIGRYLQLYGDGQRASEALRGADGPYLFDVHERRAVECADLILANSTLVQELYETFYPSALGKLYPDVIWKAEWICGEAARHAALARPFGDRDIDVLFVASSWDRPEKNFALAGRIIESCPDVKCHIVGKLPRPVPPAIAHGLVPSRAELFALMGRAKAVVSPSLWDAAPGILFEAAALGCNIVASRNCGNWRICHDELLVEPYALETFVDRVRLACGKRQYIANIDGFLQSQAYTTLVDIVEVL